MGLGKSPASMNEYTEDFLNPVSCSTSLIVNNLSIVLLGNWFVQGRPEMELWKD